MALEAYREKRDFTVTPEPRPRRRRKTGNSFVIQKHAARRLHYDFRLEMHGVLKSWAVTKGPSLDPSVKRLAVHVEDHPLEYGGFEGTIPKGEYGGGAVLLWDQGTWTPIGSADAGYEKGHLEFELHGKKLSGRWHLVRIAGKPREKRENWLLIKGDDDVARPDGAADILAERPESVKTGRMIEEIAGEEPGWSSKTGRIRQTKASRAAATTDEVPPVQATVLPDVAALPGVSREALPAFVEPMQCTLTAKPPADARWIHEIKFDGYRLQARIAGGEVKLLTRGNLDWTANFGERIIAALGALPVDAALIDGELVVEAASGTSDFSALQADLSAGRSDRFVFYAFDLLHVNGCGLRGVALAERKAVLATLVSAEHGALRYSAHFEAPGSVVFEHACRLGLEGIVSKRLDSPYRSGRGKSWVKAKCSARQELVIAGYVPSSTARKAVGSLVLGVYDGDALQHVGRVGTGFTHAVSEELFRRLQPLETAASPFATKLTAEQARQVQFVRPELVAEVELRGWTADGNLRHASFRGLRQDKEPRDIMREQQPSATAAAADAAMPQRTVKLTHPDRLYWPDNGITKEGLADYYTDVWPHIAPFIVNRPLSLLRGPEGITGELFFQKHAWKGMSRAIAVVHDPQDPAEPLISVNDLDGLIGLVQAAILEIHPWGSGLTDWERPDTVIIDLDPGDDVAWDQVIAAALDVRERLAAVNLASCVKTSGGKGLHVVVPLQPQAEWPEVKSFCKGFADAMASDSPDRYVAVVSKERRRGRILVDYLRNQRGATAVAAFSPRARPGAPVSMPLAWEELGPAIGPAYFTIANAGKRLAALSADPWAGFRASAAPLPKPKAKQASKRRS